MRLVIRNELWFVLVTFAW